MLLIYKKITHFNLFSDDDTSTPQPEKRARLECGLTETAKDGTVWHEEHLGTPLLFVPIEPYARDGQPTATARRSATSRLQSFLIFITMEMLGMIQHWTVQHARHTEQLDWFMDIPELMAFIAVIIW